MLQQQLKEKQIEEEADEVVKTYDVVLRVKPEKVSQIRSNQRTEMSGNSDGRR